ncbi:amidase [Paucibacter sp. XJ19-41]|uniref:amidase n=1 Tax=Paucibacter sp. XJ19-41 TaxID=2927824 RepID=UPI002349E376|nr:amidase [Paucibacter sp. XJ19-41]MDC6166891.1 amidase [Paucibacter sp. XJ19-41]
MSAPLFSLSAVELLDGYRRRAFSPVEVTQAVLAHIGCWEPQLCALYAPDPEAALAQARASEARWLKGEALALDGVPLTLKENIATRGTPMPLGTAATVLSPATEDAPPAARMREAGAVLLAKTTMPDYGMLSSGLSSFHPLTRNPWNLDRNPGGSSAGAAAAAAAGYGPLHLGTDIGGSLRLPASWCGIFTLKPSLGRIPIKPPFAGRVAGPMTRTVTDAALMMASLSRPDWRDTMSLPAQDIDWLSLDRDVKGLRIGLMLDAGWGLDVEPETRAAVEAAARLFEAAGARVQPLPAFSTRAMIDGLDKFWRMRSWLDISALPPERQVLVLPYIRDWVSTGGSLSAAELFHGYSQMAAFREAAVAACQPYDYVLSPVSPVPAFPAEWASPINDPQRPFEHIAFTLPYNMSEQPAASINCGYTKSGLPIGLQIIGQRFDDLGVLQMARAFEQMRPAQRDWPQPPEALADDETDADADDVPLIRRSKPMANRGRAGY